MAADVAKAPVEMAAVLAMALVAMGEHTVPVYHPSLFESLAQRC
jgi:hypothetical protein